MQTNQNPTSLKFGNRTAYCDFQCYGNGEAGCDPGFDCSYRIYNVSSLLWNGRSQLTADQFLRDEINNCDRVVWPAVRIPAEQLRLALNAAERIYRNHLSAAKRKVSPDNHFLDSARAIYQRCRRERDQWARGKTTLDAYPDFREPATRFGIFFDCEGQQFRSHNNLTGPEFATRSDAQAAADQGLKDANIFYYVKELP